MRTLVALLLCFSAGCGYRFVRPGGELPNGIRALQVPVFKNETSESGAEAVFTQAFREQLMRAGTLGDDDADGRVEGTLLSVTGAPLMVSPGRFPSYRLTATVSVTLLQTGKRIRQATLTQHEDYLSGADILFTEANRQNALRRLAQNVMREAYERLAGG
ncbi:MAG: hypothetical protein K1X64_10185 [Myxococcaceae bacterium]|nr:hypothetical protein [Myxococcaceae bacterium]